MAAKPTKAYSPPTLTVVGSVAGLAATVLSLVTEIDSQERPTELRPGPASSEPAPRLH